MPETWPHASTIDRWPERSAPSSTCPPSDLHRTDLPAHVDVRATSALGSTEVLVPRGEVVHLRGAAILGSRRADVDPADPGAPVITVSGASALGSVTVGHGDAPRDDTTRPVATSPRAAARGRSRRSESPCSPPATAWPTW